VYINVDAPGVKLRGQRVGVGNKKRQTRVVD
jgi:hypothetical protein